IRVMKTTTGNLRPVVVGEINDGFVDAIYDVCPGTRIDGLPEGEIDANTKTDNVWGPWRRIVEAWAADPDIRHEGSTGGVLTALAMYLLSSRRVAFILHAKASVSNPSFGERHLSFTEADVIEGAGSRYGPTAVLIDVNDVLDRGEPFAFIGKPCDIAALRNHARHDSRVDALVKYWLTPVCGGFMETTGMTGFLEREGIDPDSVTGVRYRGRGCPGPTRIEMGDDAREFHYLDMWGEDESTWNLPWRCKICPDGIGEAADVAAADTWPGGSPDRTTSETDPGTNAIIARTTRGLELIEAAKRDGALAFGNDTTPDEMSTVQPHQMRKKYAAWPRHQGIADAGRVVPKTHRLRIAELAGELPDDRNAYQRTGAQERIRIGKATEPVPEAET
ncbi:MAG: Coenzyme F420 hydrogenase/dehydrogenase, beta subunit C-terminal domain, partial [Hyphomicrobiaceae bacterium]